MMKFRAMMRKKEIARAKARAAAKLRRAKKFKKLVHQAEKGCKVEKDMDYRGSDLKRYHKVTSSTRCANLCAANKKCKSFTWGRAKGKWYTNMCFLKHHRSGKRVKMNGVDSGAPCKAKSKKK